MRRYPVFVLLIILVAHDAAAQQSPRRVSGRLLLYPATATSNDARPPIATPVKGRRDSLKNGAIVGAIVGGVVASAFGVYVCASLAEEGDPPCWRPVAAFGAIGAGAGAVAGIGIDAMRSRAGPRIVVRVRFWN